MQTFKVKKINNVNWEFGSTSTEIVFCKQRSNKSCCHGVALLTNHLEEPVITVDIATIIQRQGHIFCNIPWNCYHFPTTSCFLKRWNMLDKVWTKLFLLPGFWPSPQPPPPPNFIETSHWSLKSWIILWRRESLLFPPPTTYRKFVKLASSASSSTRIRFDRSTVLYFEASISNPQPNYIIILF